MGVPTIVIADPYERALFTVDTSGRLHEQSEPPGYRDPDPGRGKSRDRFPAVVRSARLNAAAIAYPLF